jgi:HEAT repeat protein
MLSTPPFSDISAGFTAHFCNRVICIFFTAALLLVWQVKAQTRASQVVDLVRQLQSQNADDRRSAAQALEKIGPEAKEAVPDLITALKDQNPEVRRAAAYVLGKIGPEAKEAVPDLSAALKDHDPEVRRFAAQALAQIATALFDARSTESLVQLKAAYEVLSTHPDPKVKEQAIFVKRTIDYLESLWWVKAKNRIFKIIGDYFTISLIISAYLLLQFTWLLFFWLRPLSLLKVIISLSKTGEKYKIPQIEIPIPLKTALVFPFFHYRPRLLDAWLRHYLVISRENFAKKQTVAQRKVSVMMPVLIDEQLREGAYAAALQPIFDKKKVTLLIAGEGGAGKTSLACQMATLAMADEPEQRLCKTHRMLPVLIEANLEPRNDNKDALFEAVRGGLRELAGEPEAIFEELLLHLLRKRRVMVIVDSLSEMDEWTRKSVRPASADFPVAALIVTSRNEKDLGEASKALLRPLRLKSDRLSTFMDRYLEQLGKRELFNDEEYFDACRRLSQLVSDREITVLIAKMYAEQMIAAKEADTSAQAAEHELPRNLPDLMLGYVKRLNDQVKAERQDIRKVVNVAEIAAWECLKHTCRPTTAKRDDVQNALRNESDAETLLKYLEERLQLIQTTGPISDLIRFSLDPLAEYLAALYLVERCGKFEDLWQEFFENAEQQPGAPHATKGFLLAVCDCCEVRGSLFGVPAEISDALARLAGLDSTAINAAQLKQRIKLLLANLTSPDAEDRSRAVDALGRIGRDAKDAVPAVILALRDQDAVVRRTAADVLGKIEPGAEDAAPALIAALNDQDVSVRRTAADVLARIGSGAKDAAPALIAALNDQDEWVRRIAAGALGEIGTEANDEAPTSIAALNDQESARPQGY